MLWLDYSMHISKGDVVRTVRSISIAYGILILAVMGLTGCKPTPQTTATATSSPAANPRPILVFMTDFGTANDAVAICHAVMVGIAPDVRIMDITHQVTPFSIEQGARTIEGVTPYYPAGTVFVGVIDPGVGTSRKAVVVKTKKGQYFVVPDNGLITPVIERDGLDSAREITNTNWMIGQTISSTFHGRDIFSPVGAHLAAGWDYTMVGPPVDQLVRLTPKLATTSEKGIDGDIIALDDPFGSLITDISKEQFEKLGYSLGDKITVQLNKRPFTLRYEKTFMNVAVGDPLLFIDSRDRVSLAINQGNFSNVHKVAPPGTIFIPKKGAGLRGQ